MTVTTNMEAAHDRAVDRLLEHRGSIRAAFDSLDLGIEFEDVIAYLERDFHVKAVVDAPDLDSAHGRMVGMAAGFAIAAVEAERLRRG